MGRQGGREAREVGGANVASPQLKMLLVMSHWLLVLTLI